MTPRELVKATLEFRNTAGRVPRQLWTLPCAIRDYPQTMEQLRRAYPDDIVTAPAVLSQNTPVQGDPYAVGVSIDDWGCTFVNIQEGHIGEVKDLLVREWDWSDAERRVHIPEELLSFDPEAVNTFCRSTDQFVMAGECPRPFEQLQFIRTTEELYMDLLDPPPAMLAFLDRMHDFYCRWVEKWAQTDVDGIMMMDDWGAQSNLLIPPELWVKYFKPLYRDYIEIAKRYGKKTFMHSDGHTLAIYPHLIELGLDALNSQIFCMGLENLQAFRGEITFWGEIDRQHLLPFETPAEIDRAVREVYERLWDNGGCIAQCEFGPGAKPENVLQVFRSWEALR